MSTQQPPASPAFGKILTNPLFLVAAGAVVLIALVVSNRGGGGATPALDNSGLVAAATQQTISEQQAAVAAALTDQQATVDSQLKDNANQLAAALRLLGAQRVSTPAAPTAPGVAKAISDLQASLKALQDKASTAAAGAPGSNPVVDLSAGGTTYQAADAWARGMGIDIGVGLNLIAKFGRLPHNYDEYLQWRQQVGEYIDGQWRIGGKLA